MTRSAAEVAADNATVVARLAAVSENPDLSDLVLMSERDGSKTPATILVLSSCSKVFLQMLKGPFSEGADRGGKRGKTCSGAASVVPAKRTVSSSFSGEVLSAAVEFAATNDASLLWSGSVELLGEIFEAAEYYAMDGLRSKASRHLIARAQAEVPDQACAVLMAVWQRWVLEDFEKGTLAHQVSQAALLTIQSSGVEALAGCECLCEYALGKVLALKFMFIDCVDLFNIVQKWVNSSPETRKSAGKRLVSSLPLERFPPSFLMAVVKKSGLVSNGQISKVFQAIALRAETNFNINRSKRGNEKLLFWKGRDSVEYSGTNADDDLYSSGLLEFSLSRGQWEFEILVLELGEDLEVGFVAGDVSDFWFTGECLGNEENGYALDCAGGAWHNGRELNSSSLTFCQGDTVCLSIDCDTGSISISVNEGERNVPFRRVKPPGDVKTFTPAVSMPEGSRVRLVRLCEVEG